MTGRPGAAPRLNAGGGIAAVDMDWQAGSDHEDPSL
jgi:hypothetical protein